MKLTSVARDELESIYGDRIKRKPTDLQHYGRDWTTYFDIAPSAIVFPLTTNEVLSTVQWALRHKIGLVPSGGRTGLSGGACALHGEIVVSFELMNKILFFDPVDAMVEIEPGLVTEDLQNFALEKGCYYPVDFAARGSSQMGGNIATNAGGIKVVRYGMTRDWVVGLEVVTGQGRVLNLNKGLLKNATGMDLRHLFIGSEGILGFITKAQIRLAKKPKASEVLLLSANRLDDLMCILAETRSRLTLSAFEMFSQAALKEVLSAQNLQPPFSEEHPYYAVVEIESDGPASMTEIEAIFDKAMNQGWLSDGLIAQSDAQRKTFWRFREDISESLAKYSPYKNDISVRVSKVPQFVNELEKVLQSAYPHWRVIWFGHIGDGNLHINILKPSDLSKESFVSECRHVDQLVFDLVGRYDGSISAEHGVGLTKRDFLKFSRTPDEIDYLRLIKKTFDPSGIMNPGKVLSD